MRFRKIVERAHRADPRLSDWLIAGVSYALWYYGADTKAAIVLGHDKNHLHQVFVHTHYTQHITHPRFQNAEKKSN